jgi:AraC-like DNA-binding protein
MRDSSSSGNLEGPNFVPPTHGNIRAAHYMRGFTPLIRNLGGDYRKILGEHEIDVAASRDHDYPLNCTSATTMIEHCGKVLNDSLFGLHLADQQDAEVFGCLTTMARAAPTLRVGIESFAKFLPVFHCPGADLELVAGKDIAEFRYRPYAFGHDEHATSHGLLLALKFLQALISPDFHPNYVIAVSDIWRHNIPEMEDRFGCKVHRKSTASAIGFPSALLDRPLKSSEPIVFSLLYNYLAQLKHANKPTIVDQVKAHVRWTIPPGNWTMDRCAAKLGLTTRALHKRLQAVGIQFSEIVDEQRLEAAKLALLESDYTLDEIANHLGYSEQSSFGRAFKRWTDLTPQAYRDQRLSS